MTLPTCEIDVHLFSILEQNGSGKTEIRSFSAMFTIVVLKVFITVFVYCGL